MDSSPKIILFLIVFTKLTVSMAAEENNLMLALEEKFQNKLSDCSNFVAKWLEDFNDRHLGNSELGRILRYEDLKPKFGVESARKGKTMKKMGMAMIPIIFHVGAMSTWMLLTSIMAAKSVAIGLALLVFKIAVSSAKVASFFTAFKAKHGHQHSSWTPYLEHPGYDRGLSGTGSSYFPTEWNSYTPESHDAPQYKTIPMYKHNEPTYEDPEFEEEGRMRRS